MNILTSDAAECPRSPNRKFGGNYQICGISSRQPASVYDRRVFKFFPSSPVIDRSVTSLSGSSSDGYGPTWRDRG